MNTSTNVIASVTPITIIVAATGQTKRRPAYGRLAVVVCLEPSRETMVFRHPSLFDRPRQ